MQIINCQFQTIGFQIENNEFGLNENFITELEQSLSQVSFPTPRIEFNLNYLKRLFGNLRWILSISILGVKIFYAMKD